MWPFDSRRASRCWKRNFQTRSASSLSGGHQCALSYRLLWGQELPKESSLEGWCVDTAAEPPAKARPVDSWRLTSQCTPWRLKEVYGYPLLQTSRDGSHYQAVSWKSGSGGPRICFIVLERDVVDCERKVSSTACGKKMHDLLTAEKGMLRGTVNGKFIRR